MSNKSYLSVYARSFSWAGFFLPKRIFKKCSALYDFCRVADNIADDDDKIENKEKISGCTVHYVNSKLDGGKTILQKKIRVFKNDTVKTLRKRILKYEHRLYPKAILKILNL